MNWLVAAGLLLAAALAAGLHQVAYAIYVLVAAVVASRWMANRWSHGLQAKRHCNRLEARVGDRIAVVVEVENEGWPVAWVLLEDLLPREALLYRPPALKVDGRRVLLTSIRKGQTVRILYQLQCNRPGYFQLGPLVMETGDLFGLHRRYRVGSRPDFLLVLPEVIPLEGYDVASRRPIGEVRMSYQLYEDPTRIAGVRKYRPGDPLGRVNWRATARTGELQSKVYEPSTVAGATLLLEFHKTSYPESLARVRTELAVTAAASIANALFEMGQQIGLVSNARDAADRIRSEGWAYDFRTRDTAKQSAGMAASSDRLRPLVVATRRGPEQLIQILQALARAELTDGLELAELIAETASQLPRDASVIAIMPSVNQRQALALGGLVRRGFAVAVVINTLDRQDFADSAGALIAQQVQVLHLSDRNSIGQVCRRLLTM